MISFNINTEELREKIASLRGKLSDKEMHRSIALGINLTLGKPTGGARTRADREIRKVFNLRQRFVLKYLKINAAKTNDLHGTIVFPTTPVPMNQYMATQSGRTKGGKRRKGDSGAGVTVEIMKGKKELIRGAFLFKSMISKTNIYGENTGLSVMHRSFAPDKKSYNGNFQFRHTGARLQIGAMFSPSPFSALMNRDVEKVVKKYTEDELMKNIFTLLDKNAAGLIQKRKGKY